MHPLAETLLPLIDLTSLSENDDAMTIQSLCEKAKRYHVAAVCIYPAFITLAKSLLANTAIKIATVANFPQGTGELNSVIEEIELAIERGADEIDVVMPFSRYQQGLRATVLDFIKGCKQACGHKTLLKVIIETETWQDPNKLANACDDIISAGADFLKTSTGKLPIGASLDSSRILLEAIARHGQQSIGFKAAGGIRSIAQAEQFIALAQSYHLPITPERFRIGASRLLDELT